MDLNKIGNRLLQGRLSRRGLLARLGLGAAGVALAETMDHGRVSNASITTHHAVAATPSPSCRDPFAALPNPLTPEVEEVVTLVPPIIAIEGPAPEDASPGPSSGASPLATPSVAGTPSVEAQSLPGQFQGIWGGTVRWSSLDAEGSTYLALELQSGSVGDVVGTTEYNLEIPTPVDCTGDLILEGLEEGGLLSPTVLLKETITFGDCPGGAQFRVNVDGQLLFVERSFTGINICTMRGELARLD